MYTKQEIHEMIEGYKWMSNVIDSQVYDYDSTSISQYGYQSAMSKAQGGTSDKVLVKVINRSKAKRRNQLIMDKLAFIDTYESYITNEKDYHILQMLKQRENHKRIMAILDMSRDTFYRRVKDIVNILYHAQH
ncbi:helix-turn-helix domain-containing protein [Staphylococcus simulans]|uniref:helix-turn-helix domain-containing protein n=1 Tax=Staphylococcus simulans TaxID=1286 RepID=UPI000D035F3F|nr:helix-turn-helix domain-containing protein [Staphylococcus simulans]